MKRKYLLIVGILLLSLGATAQKDSLGAYCNVFYVTSDVPTILPFSDDCFIADEYSIKDPTNFRSVGPIDGSISLFQRVDWVIHFYLPNPKPNERLTVALPADLYSKTLKMKPGTMFLTICDNRSSTRFDVPLDNVDFAAVSGNAKVLEYVPQAEGMPYASYKLQMDLRFRQVDRTGGIPKLIGDPIRVKMVAVIEPKLN